MRALSLLGGIFVSVVVLSTAGIAGWHDQGMNDRPSKSPGLTLVAWPFGPSNFDECILEQMKGVTSDFAAKAIYAACRKKFPEKMTCALRDFSQAETANLKASAQFIGNSFWIDVYNGNSGLALWELAIVIEEPSKGSKRYDLRTGYGIAPFSEGKFNAPITEPELKWKWSFVGAKGCPSEK